MFRLLLGGEAGQGIGTTAGILEKLLKKSGYHVYTIGDFSSRLYGGHGEATVGFGTEDVPMQSDWLDGIVALDAETIEKHRARLKSSGFLICNGGVGRLDPRSLGIDIGAVSETLGDPNLSGSVAVGVILGLFGLDFSQADIVLEDFIVPQFVHVNLRAVAAGYDYAAPRAPSTTAPLSRPVRPRPGRWLRRHRNRPGGDFSNVNGCAVLYRYPSAVKPAEEPGKVSPR